MVKIKDIMVKDVLTAKKDEGLLPLVEQMHKHRLGAIVIVNSQESPIGIITERDIIKALLTYKSDIFTKSAGDIMATPLVTLTPDEDIETATMMMSLNRIRRVPIVSGDRLEGIVTYSDITHAFRKGYHNLAEKNQELAHLATKDSLTGLFNKKYIMTELSKQIKRCVTVHNPLSVLMIDIDFFKKVNDTYGHLAGDKVLVDLAQMFRQRSRAVNIICRYGGEEFVIVAPLTDYKSSYYFAERLRSEVEKNDFHFEDKIIKFTISIGICVWTPKIKNAREMIKQSDQALYLSKRSGRNQTKTAGEEEARL